MKAFFGIEMGRRALEGPALALVRAVMLAAVAQGPVARGLRVRSATGKSFDPVVERELQQAVALANPTEADAQRGVHARLVGKSPSRCEIALSWRPKDSTKLSLRWPDEGDPKDAEARLLAVSRAFIEVFQPDFVEAGPLAGHDRTLKGAWLVFGEDLGQPGFSRKWPSVRNVELPGGRVGRVATDAPPFSEEFADRERQKELLAFARRVRAPEVAAAIAPIAEQAKPTPSPQRIADVPAPAPRFSDSTIDIASGAAPVSTPFRKPVPDSTLAIDPDAKMEASESGFREQLTSVPVPEMSIEQYAALQAEVRLRGSLTSSISMRYGVASEAVLRALQERFRKAFEADRALSDRFVALMHQNMNVFGPLAKPRR